MVEMSLYTEPLRQLVVRVRDQWFRLGGRKQNVWIFWVTAESFSEAAVWKMFFSFNQKCILRVW